MHVRVNNSFQIESLKLKAFKILDEFSHSML